ncbi:MAG: signal recognition particle-docking protein FtsY [Pseudomonadota bacterium]
MIWWRKKQGDSTQTQDDAADKLLHPAGDPDLEFPVEYDSDITPDQSADINPTEHDIIDDLQLTPTPDIAGDATLSADAGGWLSTLREGLAKTTHKLGDGLTGILGKKNLGAEDIQDIEDLLISADVGPDLSARIAADLNIAVKALPEKTPDTMRDALTQILTDILAKGSAPLNVETPANGPRVMLICGVNGVGKTTTIGKLAYQMHFKLGKKVMLAAGDTFRAAALEQLQIWADRIGCTLVKRDIGSDPAALAYESYVAAKDAGADMLIIDTAGRLHNKANLMAELEKIVRVLKKHDADLPHEILLVVDATTGQNAIMQAQTFLDIVDVSGMIVTKLDGSARGGIVLSLIEKFDMPIVAIGVGEQIDQLQPFKPRAYAEALVHGGE